MIEKSINFADCFIDNLIFLQNLALNQTFISNSSGSLHKNSFLSKNKCLNNFLTLFCQAFNCLQLYLIAIFRGFLIFARKFINFLKNILSLLSLKFKVTTALLNLKTTGGGSAGLASPARCPPACWSPRFSVLLVKLLNSETSNKTLSKLKDCARCFL